MVMQFGVPIEDGGTDSIYKAYVFGLFLREYLQNILPKHLPKLWKTHVLPMDSGVSRWGSPVS
jgi:hypothetical protein